MTCKIVTLCHLKLRAKINFAIATNTIQVKNTLLIILFLYSAQIIIAQNEKKTTYASAFEGDIILDGHLDEAAWLNAPITTDFVENEPEPNTVPSQKTEVKIIYNEKGVYFGAMMHDTQADKILKELSVRDNRNNTDWFGITLDTYQDGLNGFSFIVTAAGVQQDYKYAGGDDDSNWDAVWQSEVLIHDKGWNAEIFIPYSAIRFPNTDIQHWNMQLVRELRRLREQSYWNAVDPNFEGFINQCGHLEGIKNIKSPVRLSITPYVTGYVLNSKNDGISETGTSYNTGMDLKYGINDAFTLDMTLVPDFGQVQTDNQVLNLSPFEVFFDENRQFFTEGLELFDRGDLFYTRRVGGRPVNFSAAENSLGTGDILLDNPGKVQLYNASKISGRTSSSTGIGFFNAVASESHATIQSATGEKRQVLTSPLTNYNVLTVDQNLPNNSRVTLMNTNVMRRGSTYDANTIGAFFDLNNKSQAYRFSGSLIRSEQYYSGSENITGHKYTAEVAKQSGQIKAQVSYNEESDTYNPNDLGFLLSPNERSLSAGIEYNQPNAQGKLQRYEYYINTNYGRLYAPNVFTSYGVTAGTFYLFKSRDAVGGNIRYEPESYDYFEPRDGFQSFLSEPSNSTAYAFFSSDYRKMFAGDINVTYTNTSQEARNSYSINIEPRLRLSNKLSFFMTLGFQRLNNDQGYVNRNDIIQDIGLSTSDILMGRRQLDIFENSLLGQYIFTNRQSLSLRVRHYNATVIYNTFGALNENGELDVLDFDGKNEMGDRIFDRNFNALTVDMNYLWRFAPGSDVIINFKSEILGFNDKYGDSYFGNLGGLFDQTQQNSLSLRIVYYLDYLYLK